LYILPVDIGPVRAVVMLAAVVVTLITGADYVLRAIRLRRAVPGRPAARAGLPADETAGLGQAANPTSETGTGQ
jgi:hypothetical protein